MAKKNKFEQRYIEAIRLSIKPNYIVQTNIFTGKTSKRTQKQISNQANLVTTSTNGILSKKSRQKLLNACAWLVASAKPKQAYQLKNNSTFMYKITFATLTIPPQETGVILEQKFKALLNTWLTYARKYMKLNNYIWKIEAHKDGRLHVHITADSYLHHKQLRASWNAILKRNGLLEFHFSKFNSYDPNSTDIHSVRNVNNIQAYIGKYMSKSTKIVEDFKGRIWGCNYTLSDANKCTLIVEPDEWDKVLKPLVEGDIESKAIETEPDVFGKSMRLGYIYFLKLEHWKTHIYGKIKNTFVQHIRSIQNVNQAAI